MSMTEPTTGAALAGIRVLDLSRILARHLELLDLQTQPLGSGIKIQISRALTFMPGRLQIGWVLAHKSTVARAHQRLGIRRGLHIPIIDIATTAIGIGEQLAFGIFTSTGTVQFVFNFFHNTSFSALK